LHGQVRCFSRLVEDEPWKRDHLRASACWELERLIELGLGIYRALMKADELLNEEIYDDRVEDPEKVRAALDVLFQCWLKPCDKVAEDIRSFEDDGYPVDGAAAFRKCVAEARWVLAPPEKAFSHRRMEALRDAAIDEHRAGHTVEMEELAD